MYRLIILVITVQISLSQRTQPISPLPKSVRKPVLFERDAVSVLFSRYFPVYKVSTLEKDGSIE